MLRHLWPPYGVSHEGLITCGSGKCFAEVVYSEFAIRFRVVSDLDKIAVADPSQVVSPSRVIRTMMKNTQN